MKKSGYFRHATTVELGMGITYGKLLLCHDISEKTRDKKTSMIDYNNREVYDFFDNPFTVDCGIPDLNITHMAINDNQQPNKIAHYTPDSLPSSVYVESETMSVLLPPLLTPHKLFS